MKNQKLNDLLRYIVIAGNTIFVLWIIINGINEGFSGTIAEKASYVGLIVLLILNSIVIYRSKGKM